MSDAILAIDLGTSAFKAGIVDEKGLVGPPTVVRYAVDTRGDRVTCALQQLTRAATKALRGALRTATAEQVRVTAIGIASQAQTFVALDTDGRPLGPAVIWTDAGAVAEADEAAAALPDFAATSGFVRPSPLQLLPKLIRRRHDDGPEHRLLLLNEWLAWWLTGEAYGDEVNQGMGGLYNIAARRWNERALALAGLGPANLAAVYPAAGHAARLTAYRCSQFGLGPVPVYQCGNDQSAAAVGAGLRGPGERYAGFGTAMVVYALEVSPASPTSVEQITGLSPLPGLWFRLAVEPECGNVLDWLAKLLYPGGGVERLMDGATAADPAEVPRLRIAADRRMDVCGLSIAGRREEVARAALEYYAARFGELLAQVSGSSRLATGGGLSRSAAWLGLLSERHGVSFAPTESEHPGLLGIAAIIGQNAGPWPNTDSST